ncbi:ABC transporter ATP-binding protein [Candidatus Omnitrophota bacterium]
MKYRVNFKENNRTVPEDFWALKGVNIDIREGEVTGIIGENGAGKTTILKIIAGMLRPDKGVLKVNGTVSVLMEIGAGFQRDLTGKENIYHISSLFGLSKDEIDRRYSDIVNFAAIGRFINAPVKVYSLGMYMRLAFSIAIHVDPDILLIDDTFAVGDIHAQRKCVNKIFELKEKRKTIIFISQDMEMVKRLCTRGIFIREGTLIKEGPIDKVSSYYEESAGDKNGIAILQNGPLGIVFNNGRLILRWKDRTITSQLSGHNIIFLPNKEYPSTLAEWQVQELVKDREIIATAKWPDLPLTQHWRIVIVNEKEFSWDIAMSISKEVAIEKVRTTVLLTGGFKSWFTLKEETPFPEKFNYAWQWEYCMVDDSRNSLIGFKDDDKIRESLPTIVFDRVHDNIKMVCQVSNTGADVSGRAIACDVFPESSNIDKTADQHRCFAARVKIFDNEERKDLIDYLEGTKQTIRESTIMHRDSLSLFCKDRKVELYWQDTLITRGVGLNTKFVVQGRDYSAQDGRWLIKKEKNEKIVITISWEDKPKFVQIWRLELKDKNRLLWYIDMKFYEELKIKNKQAEIILTDGYKEWMTRGEKGNFEKLGKQGSAVILDRYINDCIGLQAVYRDRYFVLPGVLFSHDNEGPAASYISRIDKDVTLRYLEIDRKEDVKAQSTESRYFRGEIELIGNKEAEPSPAEMLDKRANIIKARQDSVYKIGHSKISLTFGHGKARLFWKGVELTKGMALYTSMLSSGMWHDSSQASWEILVSKKDSLKAIGHWPWIPVVQTWEIFLLNETAISWIITQKLWEDVRLERAQVSLMLSDLYKEWLANKNIYGNFPKTFSKHNGFLWDRLWTGDVKSTIGIKKRRLARGIFNKKTLPSILFNCSENCQGRHCIIENTDDLFEARILQCELDTNNEDASGRGRYFEGQIKVIS